MSTTQSEKRDIKSERVFTPKEICDELSELVDEFGESLLENKEFNTKIIRPILAQFKSLIELDAESVKSINKELIDLFKNFISIEAQFKKSKYLYDMEDTSNDPEEVTKEYVIKILQGFQRKIRDIRGFDVSGAFDETWQGSIKFFGGTISHQTIADYKKHDALESPFKELNTETLKLQKLVGESGSKVFKSLSEIEKILDNIFKLITAIDNIKDKERLLEKFKDRIQSAYDIISNQINRFGAVPIPEDIGAFPKFEKIISALRVKLDSENENNLDSENQNNSDKVCLIA